jgi:hypothetical protein
MTSFVKADHHLQAIRSGNPPEQARPSAVQATEKLDYSTLEHAGTPHRGKTTDAEKETVRNNLATVNERLKRDGIRTIDLDNAEHVARYGLEALAKEADTSRGETNHASGTGLTSTRT